MHQARDVAQDGQQDVDPEVLADLVVKTEEYKKKQKEDELRGASTPLQQATPVQ